MRAMDLDLRELLHSEPGSGVIHFAGQRVILLDAVALGILRVELIATFGATAARGVLTRFGYAHGWRTAESLKTEFPWDSERDWKTGGGRLHTLQGMVQSEPVAHRGKGDAPFAESLWHDSYEAEQHLLHLGRADEAVCWTLTGFASGYLSYCNGQKIYCVETRCRGKGDAVCHMVGKSREAWGAEIEPHLPFFDQRCLEMSLGRVADALKQTEHKLKRKQQELRRTAGEKDLGDRTGTVARSPAMKRVIELCERVAQVDSTVLVSGESGVGKERVARLIHAGSARAAGPFVAVNCAAVSDSLLESELFGHARGAFTGATHDRVGLFEAASGGTLFLDEVGEIPLAMQGKLLRALQEREVRRVGENKSRPIDVRVVAASNRRLEDEVEARAFRKDLYYRLRVVELHIPPLRDRKEDILPLARIKLAEASREVSRQSQSRKGVTGMTPEAADQLLRYPWPGNVRELGNAIERAVVLADGSRIGVDDLPEEVRAALPGNPAVAGARVRSLDEVEKDYIVAVLAQNGGNQARSAGQLGIGTATLYRKLKRYQSPRIVEKPGRIGRRASS